MADLAAISYGLRRTASAWGGAAAMQTSDEALAECVRATGDTAAFSVLVTRYRARVTALARRMLTASGAEEAEDVAQETFVAAFAGRAGFRRGEPFRPWLYRIAVNRCLDRLRAQTRRPLSLDIRAVPEPASSEADPLTALLTGEGQRRLSDAVAALPPRMRAVFVLRFLDDLSYTEIASATGLPLGTVKTHLSRARALLRAALADEEE